MLAGLDGVLSVAQDQQHPAVGYLAWAAEAAVGSGRKEATGRGRLPWPLPAQAGPALAGATSWPRDVWPGCFADLRATVRGKGTGILNGINECAEGRLGTGLCGNDRPALACCCR